MATYNVSISEAASAADTVGARMVSDAQFATWLAADRRQRVVLVEASCYDTSVGAEITRYMSDRGYTSQPGESPANTAYEDIVIGVPDVRSLMGEAFRGRSLISYGDVEIDNSGGERDDWLEDAWDKREVRIYLGDPSWYRSDFRLMFRGTIEEIAARDGRTIVLRLRDRQELLNKPLQVNTVAAGPKAGLKRPVCYGHCLHAEGVLSSASTGTYEFHDGPLSSIDNYFEDGYDITGSVTRVPGGGSGLGGYVTYSGNAVGMTQKVATAHVKGFESKTGDIVKRILIERGGLSEADIDPAAITAWNDAASGNAVGFYSNRDDETVGSALDTLMAGIGGFYTVGRDGRVTGGVLKRPSDMPASVLSLTEDDIEHGRIDLVRRIVPPKSQRLGYSRYWRTITAPNTNGITSAASIEALRTEYRVTSQAVRSAGVYNTLDGEIEPSCFYALAGASADMGRRYALWYDLRFVYRVKAFLGVSQVRIGDCVTLTMPRYGFDAGEKAVVVGMRESLTSGWVELELFK